MAVHGSQGMHALLPFSFSVSQIPADAQIHLLLQFMGVINTDKQRLVKRVAGKARSPVTGLSLDPNFSSHQQSMRSTVPDLFAAPEPMLPSSIAASSTTATTTHGAMSIVMPMPIPSVDLFASGIETSMPMRSNLLQLQQDQLLHHQLHHHRPY